MEESYTIDVLDHGYVRHIEHWGSDERVIEAARMSTAKGFLGWGPTHESVCASLRPPAWSDRNTGASAAPLACDCTPQPGDEKLLRYLWENKHHTPFEMAGLTIEVQAPIMVFREWHRHRVPFGYNEMSARYTPLPDVNYVPSVERLLMGGDGKNKQAGTVAGAGVLTSEHAAEYRKALADMWQAQQALYESALKIGVPKELARVHLGVGRYSRMRATANLRGWLGFLTLRMAATAQYEIRVCANAVGQIIAELHPRTWALFAR